MGDTRHRAVAIAIALAAVLAAACGEEVPPTPTPAPPTASPAPAIELPVPDGDTALTQVLLESADGTYDVYASIGQLQGAPSLCTAVLLDTGESASAPAYALTSGHCLGLDGANEIVADRPAEGLAIGFDWFVDVPEHRVVDVATVTWATTRGTDLAVLELAATPAELRAFGLRGWRPQAVEAGTGATLDVAMVGVPVGVPLEDIPERERFLRLGTCSLDADPVVLNERQWLWTASLRNDCPEVLPGNAGSAVLDRATGSLVGLINTTTFKGERGSECWLGRPCEVDQEAQISLPDTSYAQPVGGLEGCFGADGVFALGGTCPLDPGRGVTSLQGAPLAVNPASLDPVSGKPGPSTWDTEVVTDGAARYRYKIGPLGTTSCADEAGYGDPIPEMTPIDDPLPRAEQRLLLCVIAEDQPAWTAAIAVAYVDTTAPVADITFASTGSRRDGWRVEPVLSPPELSLYLVKVGPARSTDCDDAGGYAPDRRQAIAVPGRDAPARICAIGYDNAGNASEPASIVLK